MKVVAQEDLPKWVHPEYGLEKELELVQQWEKHHHEHEPAAHPEQELLELLVQ